MPIFQSPPAKRTLICQNFFMWKSAIFHSIKPPFDAEVAKKFLNGIYLLCCPVLLPQITGVLNPEVPDTTNESVQTPPLASAVEDGPAVWKVSKSRRTEQTVDAH